MSVETIERLFREFAAGVEDACARGRGAEHLLTYFAATGQDCASAAYLKMAARPAWDRQCLETSAKLLAEGVRETFARLGFGRDPFVDRAEAAAVSAFAEQLDLLFATTGAGGSA